MAVAVLIIFLIDYVVFKGERPYINKIKQDYYAEQAAQDKAIEEALPPKVVFPETGEEYFEAPELILKDEQSLLREKKFNITKLTPEDVTPKNIIPKIKPKNKQKQKLKSKVSKSTKKTFTGGKPKIAIVIDDVGMNIKQSRAAINLPAEVTLAMLPYAETVRALAKEAKSRGHELIIHTPMEAMSANVPLGSMALRSDMEPAALKAEFNKIANSFEGYIGVNNHMGSRLTQDDRAMKVLMRELAKRDLFFLDSKTIGSSIAADTAQAYNIPNATRDVFLDHEDSPEFLTNALKKAEKIAKRTGSAIAIGHPKAVTMAALNKWISTLESRGFELVPLSTLINNPSVNPPKKSVVKAAAKAQTKAEDIEKVKEIEPAAGEISSLIKKIQMVKTETSLPPISYPAE